MFKVDQSGVLTRVAGKSLVTAYSGDGGPAIRAGLYSPFGVAIDRSGNLYFADSGNSVVRKVYSDGTIATVAGNGTFGYSGDGGPAINAQLNRPEAVALDASGNLYIGDVYSNVVRKVSAGGTITTVAGTGVGGYSGDGGLATRAQIYTPQGVAVDAAGTLYIADYWNCRIRKVSTGGTIITIAGSTYGYSGDGGPAVNAQLSHPSGVAVDAAGNVYIADLANYRIRRVAADGTITTFAGRGNPFTPSGDGGPATNAALLYPMSVASDAAGNVYIVDVYNNVIRRVAVGGIITTVAGNGLGGYSGDGGPATRAQMSGPQDVAVDASGNIYIADFSDNVVRKVGLSGRITTLAGTGTPGYSGDGGPAVNAQLRNPTVTALDPSGVVYIADSGNHVVRKVALDGTITTFAGNGYFGYCGDGGPAVGSELYGAYGVAADSSGDVYIADGPRLRKVSATGTITTVAGNGTAGFSGDEGPATRAQINATAVTADGAGNLYVADSYDSVVRKIAANGTITTIAGNGQYGYSGDGGPATSAQLREPWSVALDAVGNVYIADSSNNVIRKVDAKGIITTIAGRAGASGFPADGDKTASAFFFYPSGVAVDAAGNIYVADPGSHAVFLLQPVGPAPTISSLANAASNFSGPLAPGEIVVLYGSGMGPARIMQAPVWNDGYFDTQVSGTSVAFNGTLSPIIYAWNGQVAAIVPYEVGGSTTAQVAVTYAGQVSRSLTVVLDATSPDLFTLDSSGSGQAAALNQDGTLNAEVTPAPTGSVISLYATGEGQTSPAGMDGLLISSPLPRPVLQVTVSIGGQPARVDYAGGAPGEVAGLMQINAQIPAGIQAGSAVPVVVQVGGVASQSGVTIAVR